MFKKPHNLLIVYKKRREKKLKTNDKFYQECILKNRAPYKLYFIQDGP